MSRHQEITKAVEMAPNGPTIGAFFDFDGTLISGFSVFSFIQEQIKQAHLSPREITELLAAVASYSVGQFGFSGLMGAAAQMLRGVSEQGYAEFGDQVYEKHLARQIYPESTDLAALAIPQD